MEIVVAVVVRGVAVVQVLLPLLLLASRPEVARSLGGWSPEAPCGQQGRLDFGRTSYRPSGWKGRAMRICTRQPTCPTPPG